MKKTLPQYCEEKKQYNKAGLPVALQLTTPTDKGMTVGMPRTCDMSIGTQEGRKMASSLGMNTDIPVIISVPKESITARAFADLANTFPEIKFMSTHRNTTLGKTPAEEQSIVLPGDNEGFMHRFLQEGAVQNIMPSPILMMLSEHNRSRNNVTERVA